MTEAVIDETVDNVVTENETDDSADSKPTTQVMFVVPNELKELIDKRADEEGKSTSAWLRSLVAEEFDYELPISIIQRAKKYANDDERKAAQAAKAKTRNELLKKLLAAYRAGDIDLDEDDE